MLNCLRTLIHWNKSYGQAVVSIDDNFFRILLRTPTCYTKTKKPVGTQLTITSRYRVKKRGEYELTWTNISLKIQF